MMEFEEILFRAKMNDKQAIEQIVEMYRPLLIKNALVNGIFDEDLLLIKNALVNGIFDEDLYQELTLELLKCIRYFKKLE